VNCLKQSSKDRGDGVNRITSASDRESPMFVRIHTTIFTLYLLLWAYIFVSYKKPFTM